MFRERYTGVAFNERFLPRLSTEEVKRLPKENALVVLPVGAVEQHGPHLPIFTDTLIAEGILEETFQHLKEENIWLLPALAYGKSTEHLGMAGTMTLSSNALQMACMDLAKSVKSSGFPRLVLFSTHGGNNDLLNMISREIRIETGLTVFRLNSSDAKVTADLISEKEGKFGIHGGEVETSMVLDFMPEWVNTAKSPVDFVNIADDSLIYLKGGCYAAWVASDISTTGMAGDATKATSEKGRIINSRTARFLAAALKEMSAFKMENFKKQPIGEGVIHHDE